MKLGQLWRNGDCIADRAMFADNPIERMRGLLGRPRIESGQAMVLKRCGAIHTWGMRYPIDVLFLDRNWRIVAVKDRIGPWRMTHCLRAAHTVEIAAGEARRIALQPGDELIWSDQIL
jgi:uncharacterized protein